MRLRPAFLAMALAALPAWGAEYRALGDKPAILSDAPSTRADRLFVASRMYPFEVLVKLDQWTKVRDANGEVAWIENKALGDRHTVIVTVPLADFRVGPGAQTALVFEAYKQVLLAPVNFEAIYQAQQNQQPAAQAAGGGVQLITPTSAH